VNFAAKLGQMHDLLIAQGYDVRPLTIRPPASVAEVASLEAALGVALPPPFREVLVADSGHVEFSWFTDGQNFDPPFHQNFSGDLHWSVEMTLQSEQSRREWCTVAFSNVSDPYEAVWHNNLAFYKVPNGDHIAFDLAAATYGQVVYLSHDDGEGHGYVLADDFRDLLRRWLPLACTGAEDWQWLPFTANAKSGLDPDCEFAHAWRRQLDITSVWPG
jgi:cell wall assembly regulator SMI1